MVRALRIALLLLCLAASTAQSWVAQIHAHHGTVEVAQLVGTGEAFDAHVHAAQAGAGGADLACLLCQVAGQASAPLARARAQVTAPSLVLASLPAGSESQPPLHSPSHHWSSRGPPRA